jgi:hypothetical protein
MIFVYTAHTAIGWTVPQKSVVKKYNHFNFMKTNFPTAIRA